MKMRPLAPSSSGRSCLFGSESGQWRLPGVEAHKNLVWTSGDSYCACWSEVGELKAATERSSARAVISIARPLIIGHRGYSEIAPENTLPSFKLALEAGADLVELDYQLSQDRVAMVMHDDTLDRTTNARRAWRRVRVQVAARTAAEIRTLDAGRWFGSKFAGTRVPLLTEALELIVRGGGTALVEHKSGDAASGAKLLRESGLSERVVVISFDWAYLREFHELKPDQVLGALGPPARLANGNKPSRFSGKLDREWLDQMGGTGAEIAVWNQRVTQDAVRQAHRRGLKVWVYTIDKLRPAKQMLGKGVDGIITNRVGLIRRAADGVTK